MYIASCLLVESRFQMRILQLKVRFYTLQLITCVMDTYQLFGIDSWQTQILYLKVPISHLVNRGNSY